MKTSIYACILNILPHLTVRNTLTNTVLMHWKGKPAANAADTDEIKRLLRELLLLSCQQQPGNVGIFAAQPPDKNTNDQGL